MTNWSPKLDMTEKLILKSLFLIYSFAFWYLSKVKKIIQCITSYLPMLFNQLPPNAF